MKLRAFTVEKLANKVVGNNALFPYKSSYWITQYLYSL